MSEKVVWQMLRQYASDAASLASRPMIVDDPVRSYGARPVGRLEQTQRLLGHASAQTTERHFDTKQDLVHSPNDAIKLRMTFQKMSLRRCGETRFEFIMGSQASRLSTPIYLRFWGYAFRHSAAVQTPHPTLN